MTDILEATRPASVAASDATGPRDEARRLADELIAASPGSFDLTYRICQLMLQTRFEAAGHVARHQIAEGVGHAAVYLAQAFAALIRGDVAALAWAQAALGDAIDRLSPSQQAGVYSLLVEPVVPNILGRTFYGGDPAATLRLLDIVTAASPRLRPVFDRTADAVPFDLEAQRRRGADRARLIIMPPPPSGPRRGRRVVVAMRELVFPQTAHSRPHEVGPRIEGAMAAYGWTILPCRITCGGARDDCEEIVALCERERPDLLVLDEQKIESAPGRAARAAMLDHLRRVMPALQIVGVYLDAWSLAPDILRDAAAGVDVVWTIAPTQKVWREWGIVSKCLFAPFPHGRTPYGPPPPLRPRMFFSGAVKGYNWHRAFWLTAASAAGLPIDVRLAEHTADGLSATDSSAVFLRDLAGATCAVNFSMRPDLSRAVTGRGFETCLSGALLVQETVADLDYYFVAGEHYLEFSSFAELRGIARFLAEHPQQAEAVRRRGHAYARDHYDDISVIASLERRLMLAEPRS